MNKTIHTAFCQLLKKSLGWKPNLVLDQYSLLNNYFYLECLYKDINLQNIIILFLLLF